MSLQIKTTSVEETLAFAERIGRRLKGGEMIELMSDVGGGKTTFVRGLVSGAGSQSHVSSPTFTISKIYAANDFDIVHFDFYRLQEAGLIEHEIQEAVLDPKTVVVVEWSDVVSHVLPKERLTIYIKRLGDEVRGFTLEFDKMYDYLMEDM